MKEREPALFICPKAEECENKGCKDRESHERNDRCFETYCGEFEESFTCVPVEPARQGEEVECPKGDKFLCRGCEHLGKHKRSDECKKYCKSVEDIIDCIPVKPSPKSIDKGVPDFYGEKTSTTQSVEPGQEKLEVTGHVYVSKCCCAGTKKKDDEYICLRCSKVCEVSDVKILGKKSNQEEKRKCNNCGTELLKNIVICPKCGLRDIILEPVKQEENGVDEIYEALKSLTDMTKIYCEKIYQGKIDKQEFNETIYGDIYDTEILLKKQFRHFYYSECIGEVEKMIDEQIKTSGWRNIIKQKLTQLKEKS